MPASPKGLLSSTPRNRHDRFALLGSLRTLSVAVTAIVLWNLASTRLLNWVPSWPSLDTTVPASHLSTTGSGFDWSKMPALSNLSFTPCYTTIDENFECARLELPLDYWNGTFPDRKVGLALIRLPAKVPVTDPRYGGPILINPGGPGGSGIGLAIRDASTMQVVVDSPYDLLEKVDKTSAKYFDIIGFDPRGIGNTTPGAHCFTAKAVRESWKLRAAAAGDPDSADVAGGRLWTNAQAVGASCKDSFGEPDDIKHYATTASVARDMLELIEALGQWREQKATAELAKMSATCVRSRAAKQQVPQQLRHQLGEEKLQYWGFSYGSYLGYTFASMYPDRVGRVVVDGVVNDEDYYHTKWTGNLEDTEKVMQEFYNNCAIGGEGHCPLAKIGSTPDDVQKRVEAIVQRLRNEPFAVKDATPEIVTYSNVRQWIFRALYTPYWDFYPLARLLLAIEEGDSTPFQSILAPEHTFSCLAGNRTQLAPVDGEAGETILCSDGDDLTDLNAADYNKFWRKLDHLSPTIGAIWSKIPLACTGWKFRALYRFVGPFGGNTSHPLLFIGNTADPVTPLSSARKMSAKFPSSGLITQDSAGHCSASSWSACTYRYVSDYFVKGDLPPAKVICPAGRTFMGASQSPEDHIEQQMQAFHDDHYNHDMSLEARKHKMLAQLRLSRSMGETVHQWGFGIGSLR